jgi:AraC family transcriptional regulator
MLYFSKIDESNKLSLNKPLDCDMIYYSELQDWYTENAFRSFSVKFVVDKNIYYNIDGAELNIESNQYMVACRNSHVKAYFDTKAEPVKSICIDICPQTIAQTYTILTDKNINFDNYLNGYFQYPEFCETIHSSNATSLGGKLIHLHQQIEKDDISFINGEWFMDLSERIIYQEYSKYLALNEIQSIRPATRKEILKRLYIAQDYIESNFLTIQENKEIATHCLMSEYHFYRCFKQVFKRTPHQYVQERKMQFARQLLTNKEYSISQIAAICRFPDIFTFSKCFKKHFGFSPSRLHLPKSESFAKK